MLVHSFGRFFKLRMDVLDYMAIGTYQYIEKTLKNGTNMNGS